MSEDILINITPQETRVALNRTGQRVEILRAFVAAEFLPRRERFARRSYGGVDVALRSLGDLRDRLAVRRIDNVEL